ncbi:type II secretion system F family protein [Vibrio lamellibrachiae]|uniref:type II secretion system F family protein n=1 Tax=Vibrio lamellibrachiae TaxID=2910253 RepID=UPI003D11FCA2
MHWLLVLGGITLLLVVFFPQKNCSIDEYFKKTKRDDLDNTRPRQAIHLSGIDYGGGLSHFVRLWSQIQQQLGSMAVIKWLVFSGFVGLFASLINHYMLRLPIWEVIPTALIAAWLWGYFWLQRRDKKQFEEGFPDALNMLASSLSAGESIGRGIGFVGKRLPGEVGKEFKKMAERLKLGEPIDDVFRKSCQRFPYPSFQFFVITLRANMQRGGQLKDVMSRLNRQMFEARAIERKKFAMTSEARISAKIVSATPFVFLFMLQFLSPENFEFLMFTEAGRPILYYLLISESIGLVIIWALMKRVK